LSSVWQAQRLADKKRKKERKKKKKAW